MNHQCSKCSQPIHQESENGPWFVGEQAPHPLGSDICPADQKAHKPLQSIDAKDCYCAKDDGGRYVAEASDLGWTAGFLHKSGWPQAVILNGERLTIDGTQRDRESDLVCVFYKGATERLAVYND
jgi:hypothetical protein